jgi:hypothetical protein
VQQDPGQADQTVLQIGNVRVSFYVRESSPDKWDAIGIVNVDGSSRFAGLEETSRLIVGTGQTRDEAIGDLISRVVTGKHPFLQGVASRISADHTMSHAGR